MKYGWITINITDMWNKPLYDSERVNQLLFADLVKIHKNKNDFAFVEKQDGYKGWVSNQFVAVCSLKKYKQFLVQQKYVVTAKTISVWSQDIALNPQILFYGTTVFATKLKNRKLKILLPDNNAVIVSSAGLKLIPNKIKPTALQIINEAKRFLGIPYLWGGVTSLGFDCSGLTQTICSRFGISIPRDTKDQIKSGIKIDRDKVKTGDLLFFDRHVGFAVGKNKIIHSSVSGGGVRINSLLSDNNDYRKDLDESFKTARRII